jgi:NAD(P)-dependent dehydrogenase (short-subunit alcohol dehydrogenase family)
MMLMARHALPRMPQGSAIVNISSIATTHRHRLASVYPVSKGAVDALTITMAVEFGERGIRANAVQPGAVWTPLAESVFMRNSTEDPSVVRARHFERTNLLKSDGRGWDIAHAVAFLCSDESRWITGQLLAVDGGQAAM